MITTAMVFFFCLFETYRCILSKTGIFTRIMTCHVYYCLPTWSETCLCVILIPRTCSRNVTPHVSQHDQRLVSASYVSLGLVPATWSLMSPNMIRDLSLRHIYPWELFPQHDPLCLPIWSETCLCVILIPGTSSRNMIPHVSQHDQRLVSASYLSLGLVPATWPLMSPTLIRDLSLRHIYPWD